jgi:hypothetical protein
MAWSNHLQGAGPNRGLVLTGWASDDSGPVPVAVDPATGRLLTSTTGGGGGGGTSSNFGSAFPAAGTALGAIGSTGNMTGLTLTAAGNLKVDGSSVTQPVSGTFWQATQPVSGTVTANAGTNLNTSTLALETGGNLAAIKTDVDKIPSQGQALAAASMPVVLTAAQVTTLTPPAAITGFALETGGNLAAIKTDVDKIPALGQALAASSVPVVLTAAQLTTLTPPTNTGYALDSSLTTLDTDIKSNITLHAGSNVIGHVIVDTTSTTAVTQATAANLNAAVVGTKTNNNAAPGATNQGVLPGVANAAVQTWTEGNLVMESMDLSGNQRTTLGTLLAGEDLTVNVIKVEQRFSYANMTTATTTTIKSGAGFLHTITLNTPVASATITLYDNTAGSGTKIGTITLGATLANDVYGAFLFDVSFSTGLTIVTSGATDLTISYR